MHTVLKTDEHCEGWQNFAFDLALSQQVIASGLPNRFGVQVPLCTNWKLDKFQELLEGYEDMEIIEWLKYGWPIGRSYGAPDPESTFKNHKGALDHPQFVNKYIHRELGYGALLGPFKNSPFSTRWAISPISTRPKRQNPDDRRTIVDLSFPSWGVSVNSEIPPGEYLGDPICIILPTVDRVAYQIFIMGRGTPMYGRDFKRSFHQLPLDPGDYGLVGIQWDGELFFSKVVPMGLRTACYIQQRVTEAVVHIHNKNGHWLVGYVDDFLGVSPPEEAQQAFDDLAQLFQDIGVEEAPEKAIPLTTNIVFLGVGINSDTMEIYVTPDRIRELQLELYAWDSRTACTRKQLESLIGKLSFVCSCVRPGRLFLCRLFEALRGFPQSGFRNIGIEMRKDIHWWQKFLPVFRGVGMLWMFESYNPDVLLSSDACLQAAGGYCHPYVFRLQFPEGIRAGNSIAHLEFQALLASLKVFSKHIKGYKLLVSCDNEATVEVINRGRAQDTYMNTCLRELVWICIQAEFEIRAQHIPGKTNTIPDLLSRAFSEKAALAEINKKISDMRLIEVQVDSSVFAFTHPW